MNVPVAIYISAFFISALTYCCFFFQISLPIKRINYSKGYVLHDFIYLMRSVRKLCSFVVLLAQFPIQCRTRLMLLKLINNSSSLHKGNHDRDSVWISDLNKHRFLQFYFSVFSLVWFRLRRHIKHSRQCLTTFPNTSKFVKNTPLRIVFSTIFSMFGNVVKHGLLWTLPCSNLYLFSETVRVVLNPNNSIQPKSVIPSLLL